MSAVAERVRVAAMIRDLEDRIRGYGDRALVAFSGGVDSSVVLALAARALGPDRVEAVTAISPSYPAARCRWRPRPHPISGSRTGRCGPTRSSARRTRATTSSGATTARRSCTASSGRLVRTAIPDTAVLAGANADDLDEFRPGIWAGERAGIRNPLLESSVGKATVRSIARTLGLRASDKPALACLSSRVELGIRISPELLARIDEAEAIVRALGFEVVRVRHRGGPRRSRCRPARSIGSSPTPSGTPRSARWRSSAGPRSRSIRTATGPAAPHLRPRLDEFPVPDRSHGR
jgi:uncharacterized protein